MVRINKILKSGEPFYFLDYYQSNCNIFLTTSGIYFYANKRSEYISKLKGLKKLDYINSIILKNLDGKNK